MKHEKPTADAVRNQRRRPLLPAGQVLVAGGALATITHWTAHLAAAGQRPYGARAMYAHYPPAGLRVLIGAVRAGRTQSKRP